MTGVANDAALRIRCRECGKHETLRWRSDVNATLAIEHLCHGCHFWTDLFRRGEVGEIRSVRVDGAHYVIGDGDPRLSMRGYGGRRFVVQFFDGRVIETTNLWHQGFVPEHFRSRLPDNASFG